VDERPGHAGCSIFIIFQSTFAKAPEQIREIVALKTRMRLTRGLKLRIYTEMNLHGITLKPAAASFRKLRRLWNLNHP